MPTTDVTRIAGNIGALNALNSLQIINNQLAVHQTRLATGKRLNESADDPAGMLIATSMDVRRQGLQTALKGIGDAKNLLSTMEGGLRKMQDILIIMRNKALEAAGSTIGSSERAAVETQLKFYRDELNAIAEQTKWNDVHLLTGSGAGATNSREMGFLTGPDVTSGSLSITGFKFQAQSSGSTSAIPINDFQGFYGGISTAGSIAANSTQLGLTDSNLNVTTTACIAGTVQNIETALNIVKNGIAQLGAMSQRLTFKEQALTVNFINTEAAYNRLMNADMAEEQVNASKLLILQQTATAMLAQANVAPQFLLSLFQ
jgi:flagellin